MESTRLAYKSYEPPASKCEFTASTSEPTHRWNTRVLMSGQNSRNKFVDVLMPSPSEP